MRNTDEETEYWRTWTRLPPIATLLVLLTLIMSIAWAVADNYDNTIAPYANPVIEQVGFKINPSCNKAEFLNFMLGAAAGSFGLLALTGLYGGKKA